jgi:hypothetical protein
LPVSSAAVKAVKKTQMLKSGQNEAAVLLSSYAMFSLSSILFIAIAPSNSPKVQIETCR